MRGHNHTAAERRESVIDAAITEFSQKGLHGTATEDIARRAGISQPYIFRLFGTKKDLFLAASDRICDRIIALFGEAARSGAPDVLEAMGKGYSQLLEDREELLMLLQAIAAADDPEVRSRVRARYLDLYNQVKVAANVGDEEARTFFAHGMLLTILAAIDLPEILGFPTWLTLTKACRESDLRDLMANRIFSK